LAGLHPGALGVDETQGHWPDVQRVAARHSG